MGVETQKSQTERQSRSFGQSIRLLCPHQCRHRVPICCLVVETKDRKSLGNRVYSCLVAIFRSLCLFKTNNGMEVVGLRKRRTCHEYKNRHNIHGLKWQQFGEIKSTESRI